MSSPELVQDEKNSHSDAEKDVNNTQVQEHVSAQAVTLRKRAQATLEDAIYFADQQYSANDTNPLETLEHDHSSGNFMNKLIKGTRNHGLDPSTEVHAEKEDVVPGPIIRNGPLRHIWGPTSPNIQLSESEKNGHVQDVIHVEDLDPDAQDNQETMDRLLLRRVTWMRCVFLITSDVLGPYQGPYVYSQVGYVPGTIVYVVMGVMAYLAGCVLSVLYLRTDSDKMPVRTFSTIVQRIWGTPGRWVSDFFFIVQLMFQCGLLLLTNAQSIGLIIDNAAYVPGTADPATGFPGIPKHHLCFSVLIVVLMVINLLFSFIRSLKPIAFAGTISLFLAIFSVIIITAFIYNSPVNYYQAQQALNVPYGPVVTSAFVHQSIAGKVNGIMNMVYAFGGSMVFPNFFAEMRKPWDFYKSYFVAQVIIMIFYILFGILIYARQGQFTESLFYFGVSKYAYQTVGNAIGTYTGVVAAILYGNIAQKELYHIVVRRIFKGPRLMSKQAYPFWMIGNFFIWAVAYVIGAAIPQVQTVSGVIGAATILQFSYSFPFLLKFCFDVQVDAMKGDRPYIPGKIGSLDHRIDSWGQWSRWKRGLFGGSLYSRLSKLTFLILGLASISMAGLGLYGSITSIITTFAGGAPKSFGCETP